MCGQLHHIDSCKEIIKFKHIKPENYPDYNKSAFELGYTEYIKRSLKNMINLGSVIAKFD